MRIRMLAIVGLVSIGSFSVVARQSALARTDVTVKDLQAWATRMVRESTASDSVWAVQVAILPVLQLMQSLPPQALQNGFEDARTGAAETIKEETGEKRAKAQAAFVTAGDEARIRDERTYWNKYNLNAILRKNLTKFRPHHHVLCRSPAATAAAIQFARAWLKEVQ